MPNKMNYPQEIVECFWEKVNNPGNDQDCWEWQAYTDKDGYGKYRSNPAHRFVYEYFYGPIPIGMCVCHNCDNPPCCNPDHLFLGTNQENTKDRHKKGRSAKGSLVGTSVLTEIDVLEILNKISNNEFTSLQQIVQCYNVSIHCINKILDGSWWRHITDTYPVAINILRNKVISHFEYKLIEQDIFEILAKIENGDYTSISQIANEKSVSVAVIRNILNRKLWISATKNLTDEQLLDLKRKVSVYNLRK